MMLLLFSLYFSVTITERPSGGGVRIIIFNCYEEDESEQEDQKMLLAVVVIDRGACGATLRSRPVDRSEVAS